MTAKRKDKSEETKGDSLLQLMTISLFIILLAFFILLNAIAVVDEKKKRKVVSSIVESFSGESKIDRPTGNSTENIFSDGVSPVEFEDLIQGQDKNLKDVKIAEGRKKTIVTIPEKLIFKPYGTRIKRSAKPFLRKLAKVIKKNNFPVDISCHLDDIPIFDIVGMTSRQLTALRSTSLLSWMVETGEIPATQLTAYGWGMERPQASNKTSRSRKMNRRIDITFVHDQTKKGKKGFFIFKDFFFNVDN